MKFKIFLAVILSAFMTTAFAGNHAAIIKTADDGMSPVTTEAQPNVAADSGSAMSVTPSGSSIAGGTNSSSATDTMGSPDNSIGNTDSNSTMGNGTSGSATTGSGSANASDGGSDQGSADTATGDDDY